jgi:hypothetical protein
MLAGGGSVGQVPGRHGLSQLWTITLSRCSNTGPALSHPPLQPVWTKGMWRDMRHRTITHANLSKLWNLPPIPVQPVLTALPQQLSATAERKPSRTASSAYRVFSHCYPGPRFGMQGSHGDCSGRGTTPSGPPCHGCRGTGEVALGPSDEPASRQSGRLA